MTRGCHFIRSLLFYMILLVFLFFIQMISHSPLLVYPEVGTVEVQSIRLLLFLLLIPDQNERVLTSSPYFRSIFT